MFTQMMFTNPNSVLNNRLIKKEQSVYVINPGFEEWSLYSNLGAVDFIMNAAPGNVKVKKAIREELNKAATEGFSQDALNKFIEALQAKDMMDAYNSNTVANELGMAEYHFKDYAMASKTNEMYKKIKPEDLKRIAATYFSDEKIQVINIKPEN